MILKNICLNLKIFMNIIVDIVVVERFKFAI